MASRNGTSVFASEPFDGRRKSRYRSSSGYMTGDLPGLRTSTTSATWISAGLQVSPLSRWIPKARSIEPRERRLEEADRDESLRGAVGLLKDDGFGILKPGVLVLLNVRDDEVEPEVPYRLMLGRVEG